MQTSTDIFRNNRDPMPCVRFSEPEGEAKWYTMRIEDRPYGNVSLNVHTANLDDLLDFGYAIVNAVNAIKYKDQIEAMSADQLADFADSVGELLVKVAKTSEKHMPPDRLPGDHPDADLPSPLGSNPNPELIGKP